MHKHYPVLIDYALRILSKKRYTVYEMRKKLEGFLKRKLQKEAQVEGEDGEAFDSEDLSFSDGPIVEVMERLKDLNYLNDLDYAKNFASDRARFRPRGKILIRKELMSKGIAKEDLAEAFAGEEGEGFDELAGALELIRRKERLWQELDPKKKKEKAFRFLSSKGFGVDTIYKALRSCYDNPRK